MKQEINQFCFIKRQAVITVLLLVFLGQLAWAGVAEDIAGGKPLQEVVLASLDSGAEVKDLIVDLDGAGVSGSDSICALFQAGQDYTEVIIAALDAGMNVNDVAGWASACGATYAELQLGASMAGENLPGYMVFSTAERYERNAKEYLYNPLKEPSPSK